MANAAHETNKAWWNEVTAVHVASDFYDVEGFVAGRNTLGRVETEAVGDVAGKRLLHLQCHFGMDTMSWARLGAAEAIGIDFSEEAVKSARELAGRVGLGDRVRFHQGDVLEAGAVEGGGHDVVFTSLGTVTWLSDIDRWGATVAANVAPDGFFYFLDAHPTYLMFDELREGEPVLKYPYFHNEAPLVANAGSDYADPGHVSERELHEFMWPVQDLFGALEKQGMTIFEVREYPFGGWHAFPDMVQGEDGYFHRPTGRVEIPLLLGFKARW